MELWHILGPSARFCFQPYRRKTGDPVIDLELESVIRNALAPEGSSALDAILRGTEPPVPPAQFHQLFTVVPKCPSEATSSRTPLICHVIPTYTLCKLVSQHLQILEENYHLKYAAIFASHPLVAGVAYEALALREIAKKGGAAVILPSGDRVNWPILTGQQQYDKLVAPLEHILYIPANCFPSIDAFLISGSTVILLQATIAESHTKKMGGVTQVVTSFRQHFPKDYRTFNWVFAFLVPNQANGEKLCRSLTKEGFGKTVNFMIGYCVVPYKNRRIPSNSVRLHLFYAPLIYINVPTHTWI